MIERENARRYLERRVAEYDLGVPNGANMDPDVVALAVVVLGIDERLDAIMERLERRHFAWVSALLTTLGENKAALAVIVGGALTLLAAAADQLIRLMR